MMEELNKSKDLWGTTIDLKNVVINYGRRILDSIESSDKESIGGKLDYMYKITKNQIENILEFGDVMIGRKSFDKYCNKDNQNTNN